MADPPRSSGIGQGDMYHILAAKRHRQDGAGERKNQALLLASADPPGLVEAAIAVPAGIRRMDQQVNLAGAGSLLDALGAVDQRPAAGFEAEAVERLAAERGFDAFAQVRRNLDVIRLEGAGEGALQLALGIRLVERLAADADPGATARCPGANVGSDLAIGAEGEPDQLLARRRPPGEDAAALGDVRV
jgi:hypothetical protein